MKKALLILLIGLSNFVFGQVRIDTSSFIPSVDSMYSCLKNYYTDKAQAEAYEYNYSIKYKWLKFIPTIGLNLNPISPIIALNSNQIVNQVNLNAQKKAKLLSIERTNQMSYEQDIIALNFKLSSLRKKIAYYHSLLDNLDLYIQKFKIVQTAYTNQEITPTEFLDKKIQFNSTVNQVKLLEFELHNERNNILQSYRYCK